MCVLTSCGGVAASIEPAPVTPSPQPNPRFFRPDVLQCILQEAREAAFGGKYGEAWTKLGLSSAKLMGDTWGEVRRFQQLFATAQVHTPTVME